MQKQCRRSCSTMGGGKTLTVEERSKISAFHEVGLSLKEIARRIGRTRCVVRSFLKDPENYGFRARGRPKSKVSERDRRRIVNAASNTSVSCKKLVSSLQLTVSKTTVWRTLRASPVLVRAKMQPAPRLKKHHIEARVRFGRENMSRDWSTVSRLQARVNGIR